MFKGRVSKVGQFVAACKHKTFKLVSSSWASTSPLLVFGTNLSDKKQANSASLFIPSLSFSAQRPVKAILRVTSFRNKHYLLAFHLTRAIFPFLHRYVHIHHFSRSEWRPVAIFYPCRTTHGRCFSWGKLTHSPPTFVPTKPNHQNTGRG